MDDIELLDKLEFLQLHRNFFSGTISSGFGHLTDLRVLTMQFNEFTGAMPVSVCALRDEDGPWNNIGGGGALSTLQTDCSPKVECSCCTTYCP